MSQPTRDPDSITDLVERFGIDLDQAERRLDRAAAPRRRARRLVLAGASLAVAGSAAVLAIGVGGGPTLDVVSEARAALAPEGAILHMQIAGGRPGEPDDPNARELREVWTAENPTRWKYTQTMPVYDHEQNRDTAEQQTDAFAYADGTVTNTESRQNTFTTISGYGSSGPGTAPMSFPGMPPGQAPAEALRALLASGKLRSAGTTTLSGRPALRLVGHTIAHAQLGFPSMPVEYDVDATTFAPVRILLTIEGQARPDDSAGAKNVTVIWFRAFERLPLTPENEAKLTVTPAPGAKISRYTLPVKGEPCERESKGDAFCKA